MTGAARDELILSLKPLVVSMAHGRKALLPHYIRLDDIISAAWVGAIDAVDRFDPVKGELGAFARSKISGAIGDYLRSVDPVSRDERRRFRANPHLTPPYTFSLSAIREDGSTLQFGDKRSHEAVRRIDASIDLARIICRASPQVQPRSLRIVTRHAHGETMKSIGRREGINESRVSQICKKTLAQLRAAA